MPGIDLDITFTIVFTFAVPVLANAVGAPAAATVDAQRDVRRWPCRLVRRYVYYISPSPYENKLGGIPTNPLLHWEPPLGQEPFIFEYGVVHTGPDTHADTAPRGSCDHRGRVCLKRARAARPALKMVKSALGRF